MQGEASAGVDARGEATWETDGDADLGCGRNATARARKSNERDARVAVVVLRGHHGTEASRGSARGW
jgi:hypothetical protein